jgi:hypothetical protein
LIARLRHRPGWPRLLSLLLATVACSFVLVVPARPAAAHIPLIACGAHNEHQAYLQVMTDGTGDRILWVCTKTTHPSLPVFYYWKIDSIGNIDDDLEAFRGSIGRFYATEVWHGIVQGGFGVFSAGAHRAHIRVESSFDVRHWSGAPADRSIGVHIVLKHLVGGSWVSCADTGWKDAPSARSVYSYTFWKLSSSCSGTVQLHSRGHFFSHSSQSWWTSPWVRTPTYIPT